MGNEDFAYVAGLFDGEGSITINKNRSDCGRPSYTLLVYITNTNEAVIDWLLTKFGGTLYTRSVSKGHRPCWDWKKYGNNARDFLTLINPYLRIKKHQAELAIKFQGIKNQKIYHSKVTYVHRTEEELDVLERYRQEVSKLSSRNRVETIVTRPHMQPRLSMIDVFKMMEENSKKEGATL